MLFGTLLVDSQGRQVVCMIIISQMVPLRDRGKFVGAMYARTAIATVLGPVGTLSSLLYPTVVNSCLTTVTPSGAWRYLHSVQLAVVLLDQPHPVRSSRRHPPPLR